MAERIFVITATEVEQSSTVSFQFMFESGAYQEARDSIRSIKDYGYVHLRRRGVNELNVCKIMRRESGVVGDDGVAVWNIFTGKEGRQTFSGDVDEAPPGEAGLADLLKDVPDCVLLMDRLLFERFEVACQAAGIKLEVHHFEGQLATA